MGRFSPAITSAWVSSITEMARLEGGAAEHVGEQHHAAAVVHGARGGDDVGAAAAHVVVGADGDGAHRGLRPDHVLHGG